MAILISDKNGFLLIDALLFLSFIVFIIYICMSFIIPEQRQNDIYTQMLYNEEMEMVYADE